VEEGFAALSPLIVEELDRSFPFVPIKT